MKRFSVLFLLITVVLFALTACTPAAAPTAEPQPTAEPTSLPEPTATVEPTPEPIVLTDGLGRTVTLASPAQRIVSLAPSNVEILFAVGAGKQVVGRDDFANYPEEAAAIQSIGGSFGDLNLEAITALTPDLVLAAEINTPEQVKSLEDLGLTVFYLSNPTDLEGMFENLRTVATLTGTQAEAETLIASLTERIAAVDKVLEAAKTTPKVLYELDGTDPAKPWTAGPGTFIDLLITRAKGENVAGKMEGQWVQMSQEALLVENPDFILLGDANYGTTPEQVAARTGWDQLQAVKNGNVLPFNDDTVSRPGPRLVDALEELAKIFHPELFQ